MAFFFSKLSFFFFTHFHFVFVECLSSQNLPQLVIQIWYTTKIGVEFLPIFSIIFSFLSIILTFLTLCTQRKIIQNQEFVKIFFDVQGDDIKPGLAAKTKVIRSELSALLGINRNLIEIAQPQRISKGLQFEVYLMINDADHKDLDYKSIINEQELLKVIKGAWEVTKPTDIKSLQFVDVASSQAAYRLSTIVRVTSE